MLIHVPRLEIGAFGDLAVDNLEDLAAIDRISDHGLTDDPTAADVILFPQCHMVDWRLEAIRRHRLTQSYPAKVMIYDERDRPWRSFPGIYVSMPRKLLDERLQRAWSYLRVPTPPEAADEPDLLFSFIGSPSSPCREPLFTLRHPDAVVEKVQDFMFWDESSPTYQERRHRHQEILSRSRFVLCPRGRGTSTFRLYEVLATGRVPVIISDDWVPPKGPDWDAFSIRWPEARACDLVPVIEECDAQWNAMSEAAMAAHRAFFAPDVAFHHLVESCRQLRESTSWRPPTSKGIRNRAAIAVLASLPGRFETRFRRTERARLYARRCGKTFISDASRAAGWHVDRGIVSAQAAAALDPVGPWHP